jgi:hypothetical protein
VSTSKQRLEEFRSKLELTLNSKPCEPQEKSSLFESIRKTSPYSRQNDLKDEYYRSTSPKQNSSPRLNHYKNLANFKSFTNSPIALTKPKTEMMKRSGLSYNFDVINGQDRKNEKLSDLISIEDLNKAINVVMKGGMKNMPRIYAAQLREFCNEVMANADMR